MAQPYIGEIRMFAGNFAPLGWAMCNGQLLPISENETLFQLLGTTYGGDGEQTFALPDLQGRLPIHQGNGFQQAEKSGVEQVFLTVNQIPLHNHSLMASTTTAGGSAVAGSVTGQVGAIQIYREVPPGAPMSSLAIAGTGGTQPHSNIQPFLCVNFIISLFGIFPTQS